MQSDRAEDSVEFADNVNRFLHVFGMRRDSEQLTEAAAKTGGTVGSQAWYLAQSNLGEQLWQSGQPSAAAQVFQDILAGLEQTPSSNRCLTLHMLGRCCSVQGQPAEAEQLYRQELTELAQLEQSDGVQRQIGAAWTDLADVLRDKRRYNEAKTAYQAGLEIMEKLDDKRNIAIIKGQIGSLAHRQGKLAEAAERYKEALSLFQSISEPISEAIYMHQLGIVYQDAEQWAEAEQAYRQAARLEVERGGDAGMIGAGMSWNQIAQLCDYTGRKKEAEDWFRMALAAFQDAKDHPRTSVTLSNLAALLADDPARLDEARRLAEESLAIKQTLDPAAAEIWKTYDILANIAAKQEESSQAAAYRAKGRQAYLAFPGWREQLYQYEPLIAMVVQASREPDVRKELEQALNEAAAGPKANLIAAIRSILSGERTEAALCGPLGWQEAAIIRAILEGIAGAR